MSKLQEQLRNKSPTIIFGRLSIWAAGGGISAHCLLQSSKHVGSTNYHPKKRSTTHHRRCALAEWLTDHMLCHRVKFPLLEFAAIELDSFVARHEQVTLVSALSGRPEHGSSVIIGKLLQCWLPNDLPHTFALLSPTIGDRVIIALRNSC